MVRLEREVDQLHQALEDQTAGEDGRLKAGKLDALAEFAAGAGHEINNPLAVISGQAQYVLAHADEWFQGDPERPRKALQTIIGQTHRVHGILRDVMQFARPAAPRPVWFDLPTLLAETAASLADLAEQRRVRIEIGRTPDRLAAFADVEQVRQALTCLLRNAVEAAPPKAGRGYASSNPFPARRSRWRWRTAVPGRTRPSVRPCSTRFIPAAPPAAAVDWACRSPGGWPDNRAATCAWTPLGRASRRGSFLHCRGPPRRKPNPSRRNERLLNSRYGNGRVPAPAVAR